jgi:hypothetical protein
MYFGILPASKKKLVLSIKSVILGEKGVRQR